MRIRPLLGGLDAWIDAGMPVDGDETTEPLVARI